VQGTHETPQEIGDVGHLAFGDGIEHQDARTHFSHCRSFGMTGMESHTDSKFQVFQR
jgi:hypothetical protein